MTDSTPSDLTRRLSCADSAFPRLSHDAALAVIRDLDIGAVDIGVFAGYEHNPPDRVVSDPEGTADQVRERLDRHELAVADVFAILSDPYDELAVNHPDASVRGESLRQFEAFLSFASRLQAPGVTVLPGADFDRVERAAGIALSASELQARAELAGERGLGLSFEPHVGSVAETVVATLELLEQAPDVGVTLDHSHFVYQGVEQADIDVLMPRTRHMHLRQAAPGVIQARARHGTIDFRAMLAALAELGYEGYLALEYQWEEWMEFDRVDCVGETANLRDLLISNGDAR